MSNHLILLLFFSTQSLFGSVSVDLENGLGTGSSSSLSVKRTDFYSLKASYDIGSPDQQLSWRPIVSLGENQNTYFASDSELVSMMKLQETVIGVGIRAHFYITGIAIVTELMTQKGIGSLRVNRSSPSSTQIASISKVPSTGFTFTTKSEFQISEPIKAFVGLQLRQSQAKIKNFVYEQTSAVDSGLSLSQGLNGSSDLNIPADLKTKSQAIIFGLSLNL